MPTVRMHADEVDLDAGLVRRLLAGQFPQWAREPLERFPSPGTVNAMFRLGDDKAVRLPLTPSAADDVVTERTRQQRLAASLPVAVPAMLGEGEPTDEYPLPWAVVGWLAGANPVPGELVDPAGLAADLTALLEAFRALDPAGAPAAYRGGPLAGLDEATRRAVDELGDRVDGPAVTEVWEAARSVPEWTGPPVWVHADLMPGNLLVTDAGRLSGLLDFATVGVGDPACDLFPVWNLLPRGVRDDLRSALQVDDATWERGRGRALSQAVIALPYYWDSNRAMADVARHVIQELLAEPRSA